MFATQQFTFWNGKTCGVQIYGKTIKMSSLTKNKSDGEGDRDRDSSASLRQLRPSASSAAASAPDERVNMILIDSSGKDVYFEYLPSYVSLLIESQSKYYFLLIST